MAKKVNMHHTVEVIGSRQNPKGNGVDLPGLYKVKGSYMSAEKGHLLIKDYLRMNLSKFDYH